MRVLIVEDDGPSRIFLKKVLEQYAVCDLAEDGLQGLERFQAALDGKSPYDLICLDIMMPKMDGQQALAQIRQLEDDRGIQGLDGVKIIMTTALRDSKNIMQAFNAQCEAYLAKPIERDALLEELRSFGLL